MRWLCMLFLLWSAPTGAEEWMLTAPLLPSESAAVYAWISAQVQQVRVQEGDRVAKGDTLALLDDGTLKLSEAAARLRYGKLRSRLDRAEELARKQVLTGQELDNLRFDTETAQIRWEMARMDLQRSIIRSPMTGIIAQVHVKAGDPTSSRMRLFRVIHPGDLKADLFIPADRLNRIRVGQRLVARPVHDPDRVLPGRIIHLSPVIDPESGTCQAVALFFGAGRMVKPGSVARIQLDETRTSHHREGPDADFSR